MRVRVIQTFIVLLIIVTPQISSADITPNDGYGEIFKIYQAYKKYYSSKQELAGFKLSKNESVRLKISGNHKAANNLIRLLHLYFPLDSNSTSNNIMAIVVLPDIINSVTSGDLKIQGVDPTMVKHGSKCFFGIRDLSFEGKKYQYSHILIDANESEETILKCVYRLVAISFGIDQIFSDFSTRKQMDIIGMNYILLSLMFDGIQSKQNSKSPDRTSNQSLSK